MTSVIMMVSVTFAITEKTRLVKADLARATTFAVQVLTVTNLVRFSENRFEKFMTRPRSMVRTTPTFTTISTPLTNALIMLATLLVQTTLHLVVT